MAENAPERPKPPEDFDENPEWTEEDFARARWARDGRPFDPEAFARAHIRDALEALEGLPEDRRAKLARAINHARAAAEALEMETAETATA